MKLISKKLRKSLKWFAIKSSLVTVLLLAAVFVLDGCANRKPKNTNNLCSIFKEKRNWYHDAMDAVDKWGAPVPVLMAIMYQESSYQRDAKPPRRRLMGFIPWFRPSSAFGFAQVKDGTWDWYQEKTGNFGADRNDFTDAIDFIGWYVYQSNRSLKLSKWDAYHQYIAYHEGHAGYKNGAWKKKQWLVDVAGKVKLNAARYSKQFGSCQEDLKSRSWWPF